MTGVRRGPRWRALVAAVLVSMVAVAVASPASARTADDDPEGAHSWAIEPDPTGSEGERTHFSFVVAPGGTVTDTVRITNLGDASLSLDLYAADAVLTEGAGFDMAPAGATAAAVGAWIELPDDAVVIPAGEGVDVPFELTVPDGTAPGDRTGGIVTSLSVEGVDSLGREVTSEMRLVSRVQLRVTGAVEPTLEVSDLRLHHHGATNPFASGSATVTYTVTNTGNVRTSAGQVVRLRGLFGVTGREAVLDDVPELLPGASIVVEVEIDRVWPAVRTTASVELQLRVGAVGGGAGVDAGTSTTSTTATTLPWSQALLVIVVVALVWWKRRSDRRRITRAVAAAVGDGGAAADRAGAADSTAPVEAVTGRSPSE